MQTVLFTFEFNILFALGILYENTTLSILTFEDMTEDFAQINKTWWQKSHSLLASCIHLTLRFTLANSSRMECQITPSIRNDLAENGFFLLKKYIFNIPNLYPRDINWAHNIKFLDLETGRVTNCRTWTKGIDWDLVNINLLHLGLNIDKNT